MHVKAEIGAVQVRGRLVNIDAHENIFLPLNSGKSRQLNEEARNLCRQ